MIVNIAFFRSYQPGISLVTAHTWFISLSEESKLLDSEFQQADLSLVG